MPVCLCGAQGVEHQTRNCRMEDSTSPQQQTAEELSAEEDARASPLTATKKPLLNACDAVRYYSNIGGKKLKCTLCGTVVDRNKYYCSTPLWRHLEKFHRKVFQSLKGKTGQDAQQRSVVEMFAAGDTKKQYYIGRTMERTKEELVQFICLFESPWIIVKKKYFVRLLRYIPQKEIPVPSVKAIKREERRRTQIL